MGRLFASASKTARDAPDTARKPWLNEISTKAGGRPFSKTAMENVTELNDVKGDVFMSNEAEIGNICSQIIKSCEKIQTVTNGMSVFDQSNPELVESYGNIQFDELEHTQVLVLMLTKLISEPDGDALNNDDDGSAFGPGELTAVQGEKKSEEDE